MFKEKKLINWSYDDQGVDVYFIRKQDYEKALRGAAKGRAGDALHRFEQLLESGEASVRETRGGIYIAADDAVRLDQATRECFELPPAWPGSLLLDTHSIPNLHDFAAKLRLVDERGYPIDSWSLRGGILQVGEERFLPTPETYACLTGYNRWEQLGKKSEADHLRLIHVLTEASRRGCRVDASSAGKIDVAPATEVIIEAKEQGDGSILLTPIPMSEELIKLFGATGQDEEDSQAALQSYVRKVEERLSQLEGVGEDSILRIGTTIVLLDNEQTRQARTVARSRRYLLPKPRTSVEILPDGWPIIILFTER